jgi:hypothetical protein
MNESDWAWNRPIENPGYYWVMHDHRSDEEPYIIRVFTDPDGDLAYFETNGSEAVKLKEVMHSNYNYWLPVTLPKPPVFADAA